MMTSVAEPASNVRDPDNFEWQRDYERTLEQIAQTDHVDVNWPLLRNIIGYKINLNVQNFISQKPDEQETFPSSQPTEVTPQSSAFSMRSTPPPTSSPVPTPQGMIIPPFPKREQTKNPILRLFNSTMDEKEAQEVKQHILLQLDNFDDAPPFTVQRLCELCLCPRRHHKTVGKYLRALERVIRVTSTRAMYPLEEIDGQPAPTYYPGSEALKIATTPVFSPIPFLHLDARRSRSPSPFELSATRHPQADKPTPKEPSTDPPKGLGLVDELDDPKPGHLADHPTALTAVTKIPPLSERFVKAVDEDIVHENEIKESQARSSEDAEVEEMVLNPEEQK